MDKKREKEGRNKKDIIERQRLNWISIVKRKENTFKCKEKVYNCNMLRR
jgi:hypothetical protein